MLKNVVYILSRTNIQKYVSMDNLEHLYTAVTIQSESINFKLILSNKTKCFSQPYIYIYILRGKRGSSLMSKLWLKVNFLEEIN